MGYSQGYIEAASPALENFRSGNELAVWSDLLPNDWRVQVGIFWTSLAAAAPNSGLQTMCWERELPG
jgi:hypothetical protein